MTKDLTRNQEIAQTILQQLGGNKFISMTGANQFVAVENGLRIKLVKKMCANNASHMYVVLNDMDTYDVKFIRIHGSKVTDISEHNGIYFDVLRGLFEDETGMRTSLTGIYGSKLH